MRLGCCNKKCLIKAEKNVRLFCWTDKHWDNICRGDSFLVPWIGIVRRKSSSHRSISMSKVSLYDSNVSVSFNIFRVHRRSVSGFIFWFGERWHRQRRFFWHKASIFKVHTNDTLSRLWLDVDSVGSAISCIYRNFEWKTIE